MTEHQRQSVAIMFTDLCGYSAWVQRNEAEALAMLKRHWDLLRPVFARFEGREIKTTGDGFLIEFPSTLQAVRAGLAMQAALAEYNDTVEPDRHIKVRIGIHLGDVERVGSDLFGDGVNIASRIERLAPPGGLCISEAVYTTVQNKVEESFHSLGSQHLKNIAQPVVVYCNRPAEGRSVGRKWTRAAYTAALAGIVLLAVLGVQSWRSRVPETVGDASPKVLAVLPFENLGGDESNATFTLGIHDSLITRIAKIGGMTVISRTSVMAYQDQRPNLREVAKALGVTHVVEGSVQRAGERVQIQTQLIDAATDTHLWAETYDRTLAEGFATQNEIATAIARELSIRLSDQEREAFQRIPTQNAAAFEQYVFGHAEITVQGKGSTAIAYLQKAVELDPDFALAFSELSIAHTFEYWAIAFPEEKSTKHRDAARQNYEQALGLQPDLPEGILARAIFRYQVELDFAAAESDFSSAISLLPNNLLAYSYYGAMVRRQGRWKEAAEMLERATVLEPKAVWNLNTLGQVYSALRQREAMDRAIRRAQLAEPEALQPVLEKARLLLQYDGDLSGYVAGLEHMNAGQYGDYGESLDLQWTYRALGRYQDAIEVLERIPDGAQSLTNIPGLLETELGWTYKEKGDPVTADRLFAAALSKLDAAQPDKSRYGWHAFLHRTRAYALAGLGRSDEAAAAMREALSTASPENPDAVVWAWIASEACPLFAQIGETQVALDLVQQLLDPPGMITPYQIWFHWAATPLRANPQFRELMARHGVDVSRDPRVPVVKATESEAGSPTP